jgi:dihydrofolate reductase
MKPKISAIVALGRTTRAICQGDNLLWVIPADHKRLKEKTIGHTLGMGRKTYDSIKHPLRERVNIIVTRNVDFKPTIPPGYEDVVVRIAHSTDEGLKMAIEEELKLPAENKEVFIFGGAQIYEQTLDSIDTLYLTVVDSDKKGTAFFPEYEELFKKRTFEQEGYDSENNLHYTWLDLKRE